MLRASKGNFLLCQINKEINKLKKKKQIKLQTKKFLKFYTQLKASA